MKALEKIFIGAQAVVLLFLTWRMGLTGFIGGAVLLGALNVGVKLVNMYRMDPRERQNYQDSGGSGIWC